MIESEGYANNCFSIGHAIANCRKLHSIEKFEEKEKMGADKGQTSKMYVSTKITVLESEMVQHNQVDISRHTSSDDDAGRDQAITIHQNDEPV
ncbi:hypothetical protein L195_g031997 [Trifolium pratense]|uniref:Uncharacterized protein n=1 Tax=Trifolium pratense TaxID=57577 RepID=A0A2K3LBZ5_TRIPR|nr:hypothetical protein L195_g031997 [Trifolium pratense]